MGIRVPMDVEVDSKIYELQIPQFEAMYYDGMNAKQIINFISVGHPRDNIFEGEDNEDRDGLIVKMRIPGDFDCDDEPIWHKIAEIPESYFVIRGPHFDYFPCKPSSFREVFKEVK